MSSSVRVAVRATFVLLALAGCEVRLAPSCEVAPRVEIDRDDATRSRAPTSDDVPVACPGPRGDGTTPCFRDCGPGQYCDQHELPECRPGCASDEQCGPTDRCVRTGGATIGRCESCAGLVFADPPAGCIDARRTGVTECFHDCGPGTYCQNRGIPECVPGCVTDGNCGPSEHCERPDGAKVGVCASCYDVIAPR